MQKLNTFSIYISSAAHVVNCSPESIFMSALFSSTPASQYQKSHPNKYEEEPPNHTTPLKILPNSTAKTIIKKQMVTKLNTISVEKRQLVFLLETNAHGRVK
jgi:hypothetical protein